jgi:DNA-binding CsgD family transcriptional regulator/nucleoside 2-deoxyribosyltransferase
MATKRKSAEPAAQPPIENAPLTAIPLKRPVIFISHDHRDAKLAEHFENLLVDASGGVLRPFRSSAKQPGLGLEFGAEWYSEIMGQIHQSSDVVALLTGHSIDRPWILFETGYAKAKLGRPVFGIVFSLQMDQAAKGPFAQFQNSPDDEDSLTKLVIQLIKSNTGAEPREPAVRKNVIEFLTNVSDLAPPIQNTTALTPAKAEAADAAKLFEEVKILLREFSENLSNQIAVASQRNPAFDAHTRLSARMDMLSERELLVARSAADGKTNKQIADELGLSEYTVKNFLFRAFEKLGVSNRVELLFAFGWSDARKRNKTEDENEGK